MKKIIISGMLGNGLEWYDFAVYAYLTLTISKLFFPAGDPNLHLLATLGIFAVGFIARPIGGVLFGWIGDRFGRRIALVLSIFMMAIPTGLIGLLPTYAMAGMVSPILLVALRVLQGLSLGGAFCGSMTFLVEHAPIRQRGLIGSTTLASLAVGFILGAMVTMVCAQLVPEEAFDAWGWRIPFLLGIPIGFIGFYIRHHCDESPVFEAARREGTLSTQPVRDAFAHEWKHMAQAVGIYVSVTMPFYLLSAYFITFTRNTLGRSQQEALALNMLNMLLLLVAVLLSAWLSDKVGRKKIIAAGAVAYLLLAYPIMGWLQQPDFTSILLAQALFALLVGWYTGPVPTLLVEIFPTRMRYTGMALSYNLSAALFGGTAPMVCQWLITETGDNYSIAYYVMGCAIVSLATIYFYRDRHLEPLS
jgi:MHS family proline/betaine transporter-like MFS transporter